MSGKKPTKDSSDETLPEGGTDTQSVTETDAAQAQALSSGDTRFQSNLTSSGDTR